MISLRKPGRKAVIYSARFDRAISFRPGGDEGPVDKSAVIEFAHDATVDDFFQFDLSDARLLVSIRR
jgi:hypothetical protein